jgi:hypothetical protein
MRSGFQPSAVASAFFDFTEAPASLPLISPAQGTYTPSQVRLGAVEPGAVIRYTLDGSRPSANSPAYTGPFT